MLASIRTSWEQGVASDAMAELDYPEYSVYGFDDNMKPYSYPCPAAARKREPLFVMQFGLSAAVRQSPDGRLSQEINDGQDGAALDGASSGIAVLIGVLFRNSHSDYLAAAAKRQMDYLMYTVPRTHTGAISHRAATRSYWADAVYVGFPFIASYGAVYRNETLLFEAYNNCRLYRDALQNKTTGLWSHIYNDDAGKFDDAGQWATGNAWAAKGMLNIATIIEKAKLGNMTAQVQDLKSWVKEILNGTFARLDSDNLVPNYMEKIGNDTFGDAAASSMLAATAFRAATIWPAEFTQYVDPANKIKDTVIGNIDDLGLLKPIVNPLSWHEVGILGTESQAFGIMMYAAWRDYAKSVSAGVLHLPHARRFSHDKFSHGSF
ncbi:glycoside hydrolase family 88 protein [Ceratobasidium sp. AG-Ba]|nr:glycoside hydrolase family 88 protein [Ceratobasidium sp. AG-Ba]QRW02062.1 glycoside hydrolase family 88 protein [Ceratobasidium sp. AG-Ba]